MQRKRADVIASQTAPSATNCPGVRRKYGLQQYRAQRQREQANEKEQVTRIPRLSSSKMSRHLSRQLVTVIQKTLGFDWGWLEPHTAKASCERARLSHETLGSI